MQSYDIYHGSYRRDSQGIASLSPMLRSNSQVGVGALTLPQSFSVDGTLYSTSIQRSGWRGVISSVVDYVQWPAFMLFGPGRINDLCTHSCADLYTLIQTVACALRCMVLCV